MPRNNQLAYFVKASMKKRGWLELPAEGNSMFPYIRQGDICRFEPVDPVALKKGDVVLFGLPTGQLVAHRYYWSKCEGGRIYCVFKGDTNLGFDEPVLAEDVIGKLVHIQKPAMKLSISNVGGLLWGRLIMAIPSLSGLLRSFLNRKRRSIQI